MGTFGVLKVHPASWLRFGQQHLFLADEFHPVAHVFGGLAISFSCTGFGEGIRQSQRAATTHRRHRTSTEIFRCFLFMGGSGTAGIRLLLGEGVQIEPRQPASIERRRPLQTAAPSSRPHPKRQRTTAVQDLASACTLRSQLAPYLGLRGTRKFILTRFIFK